MSLILPINIDDLLRVESARIEFKASWDDKITLPQIVETICAFANDFDNINGGYIVLGIAEDNGCAILPPKGLDPEQLDKIQRAIRGKCTNIDPPYQPVFSPELINGKHVLVIWTPASDSRPHTAPSTKDQKSKKYFIRKGAETIEAKADGLLPQLLQMTARIPFDDRRALQARTEDMRETKVREFLRDIRSGLLDEINTKELYRKLRIAEPVNGHDAPKNIGLLMFSEDAGLWFRGAKIEVVQFAADVSGDVIEEKIFKGGIHEQLRDALAYLETISSTFLEKRANSIRVKGWVSYPIPALREALANAIYHRSYESAYPDPIKIYLYPDRIEVISCPGPVPGIKQEDLQLGRHPPPVPARNRRIGEFLKDLRLAEGRGTGLPKLFRVMRENGSSSPKFDFAENYFRVTLPAHPEYVAISALRDAAHLQALGNKADAFRRLEDAWNEFPNSPTLSAELIRLLGHDGRIEGAQKVFAKFKETATVHTIPSVTNVLVDALFDAGMTEEANKLLDQLPQYLTGQDALDAAIMARRLGKQEIAHRYFDRAGETVFQDARSTHEFAQTKIKLAQNAWHQQRNRRTNQLLLKEAKELLERVTQLDTDKTRQAWAWYDLGRTKHWLRFPKAEVLQAYQHAITLLPGESRFQKELTKLQSSQE